MLEAARGLAAVAVALALAFALGRLAGAGGGAAGAPGRAAGTGQELHCHCLCWCRRWRSLSKSPKWLALEATLEATATRYLFQQCQPCSF